MRLAGQLQREQGVAAAIDGFAKRRGGSVEVTREAFAFELAALAEQLARHDVAVEHRIGVVGEHQRERRGLYHGVEHQLTLVQALPLDAQAVSEAVIRGDQLPDLVLAHARDADAEIAVLDAGDAIGERTCRAAPARRERAARPRDQRHDHEQGGHRRHPAGRDEALRDEPRSRAEEGGGAEPERGPSGHGSSSQDQWPAHAAVKPLSTFAFRGGPGIP
jgi:hypothetical protein